ncbi:MAG: OmpH family outer membrane protein [Meiothermus sp.]|uniref:OmpH family outer membrane protein n=1 Tax=Meiothermus sp. TaxID=1955249 RepID=UPI0025F2BB22|nr:OmpH family outer membrane protein [Meiothermus sp.]MCS7057454.1 OmpH family outer membrane protein [Meiothermus sp.]MCS7194150.1 OmpH family outer membrane protein [Meiothermus sp.]MCX7740003.1 OmpH family outer membrane protein [Meiothermus sp.]MDW8091591.1 OmpH family outer membrane protein [Meiothermus sp.]MDW8481539.1 OmpH family outer membrane protein [Meiothermus sp.]
MKRFPLLAPSLAGLLLSSLLMAQDRAPAEKIGYLNLQAAVEAHPGFSWIREIQAQAQAELKPLQEQLQTLESKVFLGNPSQEDQQAYRAIQEKLQQTSQKWAERQNIALSPITQEVGQVLVRVAQQQGFGLVFDQGIAAQSGLVVYASSELDLTPAVLAGLTKR